MNEQEQKLLESLSKLLGNPEVSVVALKATEEQIDKKQKEQQLLDAFELALLGTVTRIEEIEKQVEETVPVEEAFADIKNDNSREVTVEPSAATPVQPQPELPEPDFITKSVENISKAEAKKTKKDKPVDAVPKSIRKEIDLLKKSVVDLHSFASRISQMGGGGAGSVNELYFRTVTVSANYTCIPKDYFIGVNNNAPCTIKLPINTAQGRNIVIKDVSGSAAINNITILPQGTDLIDGKTSYLIQNNYESLSFIYTSSGWSVI